MTLTRRATLLSAASFLAACKSGGGNDSAPEPKPEPAPSPPQKPVQGHVFSIEASNEPKIVDRRMAGVNYLFTRDSFDGSFGWRAMSLRPSFLRWPGGAIAESEAAYHQTYFENGSTRDWSRFSHNEPWSLSKTLDFSARNDLEVMVVLPTKKYLLAPGRVDHQAIRREIGPFIRELTRGRFGDISRIPMVEIGNEFYWGGDKMEAEDYVEIAAAVLTEIRASQVRHIDVALQAGRFGNSEIARVASGFSAAQKAQVDYLADHIYTRDFAYDDFERRLPFYRNYWGDKPLLISEWNVKADNNADPTDYAWGIEQAAAMTRVWDAMIRNNAKAAHFWAVQQNNWTSAYPREGEELSTPAYIGGEVAKWLFDTVGMTRQDVIQRGESGMAAYAYRRGRDITVFVAGLEAGRSQVKLEFPGLRVDVASATRMSGVRDQRKQVPTLEGLSPSVTNGAVQITINRQSPQELVRLKLRVT